MQLLSKEFQKIVRRSELGRRSVDVLVQVWSVAGREQWVLLHVEVQAQRDPEFPRRMFDYYSRICQRYNRPVASLAILADAHPRWKPTRFQQALWGCESQFRFPVCKLLGLARAEHQLLKSDNPFAIVVLAQIKALQTQGAFRQRRVWKATLAKLGHERGYPRAFVFSHGNERLESRSTPRLSRAWTCSNTSGAVPQPQRSTGRNSAVRSKASAQAALGLRSRQRSSPQRASRRQWLGFSTDQCPRAKAASRAGPAWRASRLVRK
mgnify:CR=1 FL=1